MACVLLRHAHGHLRLPFSYSSTFLHMASTRETQLSAPVRIHTLSGMQDSVRRPPSISTTVQLTPLHRTKGFCSLPAPFVFCMPPVVLLLCLPIYGPSLLCSTRERTKPAFSNRSTGSSRHLKHSLCVREMKEHFSTLAYQSNRITRITIYFPSSSATIIMT